METPATGSLVRAWQGLNRVSVSIAAGAMLTGTLHPEGDPMFKAKIGAGLAVTAALVLGAGPALAATGWTTVSIPPTGDNAYTLSVSADSNTDAWAVGTANLAGADAGPLIDHWNGTSWSQATAPSYPAGEPGRLRRRQRRRHHGRLGGRVLLHLEIRLLPHGRALERQRLDPQVTPAQCHHRGRRPCPVTCSAWPT